MDAWKEIDKQIDALNLTQELENKELRRLLEERIMGNLTTLFVQVAFDSAIKEAFATSTQQDSRAEKE